MTTLPVPAAPTSNKGFLKLWGAAFPIITALLALVASAAHWSPEQTILVVALANALSGLVLAVTAHYWPDSSQEPVAIQTALNAVVLSLFNVGNIFGWWHLDSSVVQMVNGLLGFAFALPALKVHQAVYAARGVTHATGSAHAQGMAAAARKIGDGSDLPGAPK